MKFLFLLLLCFANVAAFASDDYYCGNLQKKQQSENGDLVLELITRPSYTIEFLMYTRDLSHSFDNIKIVGGMNFNAKKLPTCDDVGINWNPNRIFITSTSFLQEHTATYRVCAYDIHKKLVRDLIVCGWETGD